MIAQNLLIDCLDYEVFEANEYVKIVESRAEYMSIHKNYTEIYYPTNKCESDIEYGFRYTYYRINGKLYDSIMTNKMSELEKLYKNKSRQLSLF